MLQKHLALKQRLPEENNIEHLVEELLASH